MPAHAFLLPAFVEAAVRAGTFGKVERGEEVQQSAARPPACVGAAEGAGEFGTCSISLGGEGAGAQFGASQEGVRRQLDPSLGWGLGSWETSDYFSQDPLDTFCTQGVTEVWEAARPEFLAALWEAGKP